MPRATNYQCEICGKDFDSYDEADACEKQHVKAVIIAAQTYTAGAKYPREIVIEMADGERRTYYWSYKDKNDFLARQAANLAANGL